MKKLHLAFTSSYLCRDRKIPQNELNILSAFKKRGVDITVFDATKLQYLMTGKPSIRYAGYEISEADMLLIRRARYAERESFQIARIMEQLGATVIDGSASFEYPTQKLIVDLDLYDHYVSPETAYLPETSKLTLFSVKESGITFPFVLKPQAGTLGHGAVVVYSEEEFLAYPKKYQLHGVIAQEYVTVQDEFRVLVLGGKSLGAVKKQRDLFYRQSTKSRPFEYVRDKEVERFAEKVCSHLPGDFYGVDVARNDEGELYLFESNRNPSFGNFQKVSGLDIPGAIADFCLRKHSYSIQHK